MTLRIQANARQDRDTLAARFDSARRTSVRLVQSLSAEDMTAQVSIEASPTKWHLAHTTWFFETFILERYEESFAPYDPAFRVLFNSYYTTLGDRHPRASRGLLTRPGVGEVLAYRDSVDERLRKLLPTLRSDSYDAVAELIELGIQHEQQHQELLLTDIKLLFHASPLRPSYRVGEPVATQHSPRELDWVDFEGGVVTIGREHSSTPGRFAYDNEGPIHRRFLEPYRLASRLTTNAEYARFLDDDGYTTPSLWLDEGWNAVQKGRWSAPMYWEREDPGATWREFTVLGMQPLRPDAPVTHLSFFEADAFARWSRARLPTEIEWEHAATPRWERASEHGQFLDPDDLIPAPGSRDIDGLCELAGHAWEWTRSAHEPYPGYAPPPGAVGEYNGKFMSGSYVLRGGSCATPVDHARPSYRNFFPPNLRWQFAGVRLARSAHDRATE
jgi:ergothioneine biosynthesis protein EgtB